MLISPASSHPPITMSTPASGTQVATASWTDDTGSHAAPIVLSDRPAVGPMGGWSNVLDAVDAVAELTKETPAADTVAIVKVADRYTAVPVDIVRDGTTAPYDLPGHALEQYRDGRLGPELAIADDERFAGVTDDGMASFRTWPPA